jgi:hypothetical protein
MSMTPIKPYETSNFDPFGLHSAWQELQEKVLQAEAEHRRRIAEWQKRCGECGSMACRWGASL